MENVKTSEVNFIWTVYNYNENPGKWLSLNLNLTVKYLDCMKSFHRNQLVIK